MPSRDLRLGFSLISVEAVYDELGHSGTIPAAEVRVR